MLNKMISINEIDFNTLILSAAKAPKKEGTGYRYPTTGRILYAGMSPTNGRKADGILKFY